MPFSNYIYEYYDGISSGNITVGKWVRLLYEYIVKGFKKGFSPSTRRRQTRQFGSSKTFAIIAKGAQTF